MKYFTLLFFAFALGLSAQTANVDNTGTEFFLGFMENYKGAPNLVLYLTGKESTSGTVSMPGISFSTTFSVTPGSITAVTIPVAAESLGSGVGKNGIHVVADKAVSIYGLNQIRYSTDAYLALPYALLGKDHIVLGYAGDSNGPSEFQVVSTADGNQVTVTPSQAAAGHPAGIPFTITLNKLETLQLQGDPNSNDLSGSTIQSTGPVAVFGGAVCTNIPDSSYEACDHLVEQIPATDTWGTSFLTVPLATRLRGDTFRVIAKDDLTEVTINGSVMTTLNRAQIYQTSLSSNTYNVIQTNKPVLVAQYSNSTRFDGVTSDPFMMLIQPTEQFLNSYTVTTPAASPVAFTNYINIVAKTSDLPQCLLDGSTVPAAFSEIGTSGYSGAKQPVGIGTHNLSCPSGMGAYVYGFAKDDSYGYPGGLGLRFINTQRCDTNNDGKIDMTDVSAIFAARNTAASGPDDPRDADGDLRITVADARACQQKVSSER